MSLGSLFMWEARMDSVIVTTPNKSYDIVFESNFNALADKIQQLNKNYSKIAIITDDKVGSLYSDDVKAVLSTLEVEVNVIVFPNGEKNKNYKTINHFYEQLIENQYDRKALLVALGGGVVGDMVGFTAATYMRGVDFVQVPTSLLSQVDSSVGGKTGIDFKGYKNIVGAFYQPELVYVNTATLKTLPPEEFASGMGEALKHGMIQDSAYLEFMINEQALIQKFDHEAVSRLVGRSCEIKAAVVSEDEKEHGLRAILNFGHTIGHAVERLKNFELTHGGCVALGMVASAHIAQGLGHLSDEDVEFIIDAISLYKLPTYTTGLTVEEVYEQLFYDKKTSHSVINIVLLNPLGSCYQNKSLTETEIKEGLKVILK